MIKLMMVLHNCVPIAVISNFGALETVAASGEASIQMLEQIPEATASASASSGRASAPVEAGTASVLSFQLVFFVEVV